MRLKGGVVWKCAQSIFLTFVIFCFSFKKNSSLTTGKNVRNYFSFDIPHPKIKVSYPSIYLLCMGIVIREEKTNKKVSNIFFGELWTLGSCCFVKNRPDRKKKRKKRRRDQIVTHDQNEHFFFTLYYYYYFKCYLGFANWTATMKLLDQSQQQQQLQSSQAWAIT